MSEAIIGFIGVIIGAFLTPVIEWVRAARTDRKHARYMAIRVISIIDEFVDMCVEVAADSGEPDQGGWYYYHAAVPKLEPFPDGLDWEVIDHKLAYDILSLPNKLNDTKRNIRWESQHIGGPNDELGPILQYEYSTLGLFALDVSNKLRNKYKIQQDPVDHRNPDWSAFKFLSETKEKIEKNRKEYEKKQAEFLASLDKKYKPKT